MVDQKNPAMVAAELIRLVQRDTVGGGPSSIEWRNHFVDEELIGVACRDDAAAGDAPAQTNRDDGDC